MGRMLSILAVIIWIFFASGCSSYDNDPLIVTEKQRASVGAMTPSSNAASVTVESAPSTECGPYVMSKVYPVKLDISMPKEVRIRAAFSHFIAVTNLTDTTITGVVVTERIPKSFKFVNANPRAKTDGDNLTWAIDSLKPQESRQIAVVGTATNTECLAHCVTVTYMIPGCAWAKVVEPKLTLTKKAPDDILICDPIDVEYVVKNSGNGLAKDVKVIDTLPAFLSAQDGKSLIEFNLDTLAPGQSKTFSARLKAQKTGRYTSKAVARSTGSLEVESLATTTVVSQPVLGITKTGPEKLYFGRPVTYKITVANKGDGIAKDVIIEDIIPFGVTSPTLSGGGILLGNKASWQLGTLAPNSSKTVTLSYLPAGVGTIEDTATATAHCAEGVRASISTSVLGIAAILLEVIDLEDPIEVGQEVTYMITATNQGSRVGTNIRIVCTLEENVQYVSSNGPTWGSSNGATVTFAPLSSLAPKAKATWQVVVKAVKEGDVRFKVEMNTDQLGRPVEETEATHLYE